MAVGRLHLIQYARRQMSSTVAHPDMLVSGREMCKGQAVPDRGMAHGPAPVLGLLAFGFYLVHATYHVLDHHPENLLWSCHLATVLVGIALWRGYATVNGIAFLWLIVGDLIWVIDLANGAEFLPTSLFTHVGGLILSVIALAKLGMPRQAWWKAMLAIWMLQEVTRRTAPPAGNVNLAFGVWPGWEGVFPSYLVFELMLLVSMLSIFFIAETVARQILARGRKPTTNLRWDRAA